MKKTPTEIVAAFQSSKGRKAIGMDRFSDDATKDNFESLHHCFSNTFKKLFESAACSTEWKTEIVNPFCKSKGSRSDPDNYRGISILPAMYKIYSKILHAWLVQWLNAYDIQPESQHVYRSGDSSITAITTPLKEVQIVLDATMPFCIVLLTLEKHLIL